MDTTFYSHLLDGKVVVITGASRGMGAEYSVACAAAGAKLALFSRGSLKTTAERVEAAGCGECLTVNGDIGKIKDVENLMNKAVKRFGRIDVLVNNAGVVHSSKIIDTTEDDWQKVININLKGTYFACKFAAASMIKQKKGVIINIGSELSFVGAEGYSLYSASKAAILTLTRSLALELGKDNIRVMTLCPGPTNTDMCKKITGDPEAYKALKERGALDRINEPEDLAPTLVLLASDLAKNATGNAWVMDAGVLAR